MSAGGEGPRAAAGVPAIYRTPDAPDLEGNPFAEALPPPVPDVDLPKRLRRRVARRPGDVALDPSRRAELVLQILEVVQPLSIHFVLHRRLAAMLRAGYAGRNPVAREALRFLAEEDYRGHRTSAPAPIAPPRQALGLTAIGYSGVGKTRSVQAALAPFPQVISHRRYRGRPFLQEQLVWLHLDVPHDASLKSLCFAFFHAVDELLDTRYYDLYARSTPNTDAMVPHMGRVARLQGLGLLVIDEVQHLWRAPGDGRLKVLNFLVGLMNRVGVPVLFVGNEEARGLLAEDPRHARRATTLGEVRFEPLPNDDEFALLCDALLEHQYLKDPVPFGTWPPAPDTAELVAALHERSRGLPGAAASLLVIAQFRALERGLERLTPEIVRRAALVEQSELRKHLDELQKRLALRHLRPVVRSGASDGAPAVAAGGPSAEPPAPAAAPAVPERRSRRPAASVVNELVEAAEAGDREGLSAHDALEAAGFIRTMVDGE
ncbi:AAA family ATPase [Caenispirillum salinarum]|uniref:AAA family ATPase n=1 Tax=Caenispirillum salinarum TaxID=859058 RepID=UPI00384C9C47